MVPYAKAAKIVFIVLICVTGVLVLHSVGASIWSQIGEAGWVAKAAYAVFSWIVTIPFLLASIIWEIVLLATRRSREEKFAEEHEAKVTGSA